MITVLLDEGVPRLLAGRLLAVGVQALEFPNDWKRLSDGALLDRAAANGFSILVSCDLNMPFQTPLRDRAIAVLLLRDARLPAVLDFAPKIAAQLPALEAGQYALLGREGSLPSNPTKPLWD